MTEDKPRNKDLYWDYMINFFDNCLNITNPRISLDCSIMSMELSQIPVSTIGKCEENSFYSVNGQRIFYNNNTVLEEDSTVALQRKLLVFPALQVNNVTIMVIITNLGKMEC